MLELMKVGEKNDADEGFGHKVHCKLFCLKKKSHYSR